MAFPVRRVLIFISWSVMQISFAIPIDNGVVGEKVLLDIQFGGTLLAFLSVLSTKRKGQLDSGILYILCAVCQKSRDHFVSLHSKKRRPTVPGYISFASQSSHVTLQILLKFVQITFEF